MLPHSARPRNDLASRWLACLGLGRPNQHSLPNCLAPLAGSFRIPLSATNAPRTHARLCCARISAAFARTVLFLFRGCLDDGPCLCASHLHGMHLTCAHPCLTHFCTHALPHFCRLPRLLCHFRFLVPSVRTSHSCMTPSRRQIFARPGVFCFPVFPVVSRTWLF